MSLKNLWTLNIDETLVASKLKGIFSKKDYEVFMPLNSQLKDIDLLLVRFDQYKAISIQVKGSRTYEPQKSETKKYGNGSAAWFRLTSGSIFETKNSVSFYIFVLHCLTDRETKKSIHIEYLIIPAQDLENIAREKTVRNGFYSFTIWVDPVEKRAFDFKNPGKSDIPLENYLNNWGLIK